MIYFAQIGTAGPIKIGFSGDPKKRVAALRREFGRDLRLLAVVAGNIPVESLIHSYFAASRLQRELFAPSADLLDYIASIEPCEAPAVPRRPLFPDERPLSSAELDAWRQACGITKSDAIKWFMTTRRTYRKWEQGQHGFRPPALIRSDMERLKEAIATQGNEKP